MSTHLSTNTSRPYSSVASDHRHTNLSHSSEGAGTAEGSFYEQPHRLIDCQAFDGGRVLYVEYRERRHTPDDFTRDVQGFPAGGKDAHSRTGTEEHVHKAGARLDEVLAIVRHYKHLPGLQSLRQRSGERAIGLLGYVQNPSHCVGHQPSFRERYQPTSHTPSG